MKQVSFEVAKALKEAGYPQGQTVSHYTSWGELVCYGIAGETGFDVPTYLDVWLWLWRTKGFYIDIAHYYNSNEVTIWDNKYNKIKSIECMGNSDPEEVIEKAIEYLVTKTNDLIK